MKKLISFVSALAIIMSCTACGGKEVTDEDVDKAINEAISDLDKEYSSQDSVSSKEEETEVPTEEETSEFEFAIKSTSLSKNYDDTDVLVIEYDFTNNSDKATSFTFACQDTVFQDGVEGDSIKVICDDVDAQQQLNDIQPGKTYTLKVGYSVPDINKPVDVVITDLFGSETFLEQTIELN